MYRVMLVDDETNVLKSLRRTLGTEPYEVEVYASGSDALKRARESKFDLVMSDYRMPGMDGVAFLTEFKKMQPDAVRLILSGYSDLSAQLEALNRVGVYRIINKPWNDQELKEVLASALRLGAAPVPVERRT